MVWMRKQKNKKNKLSTAVLAGLLGINAVILGSQYNKLVNMKRGFSFYRAVESERPLIVPQEEILESLINELPKDFKVSDREPMVHSLDSFVRREDGGWSFGIFTVGNMIVANNTLHNGTLYSTLHDGSKEFVVKGKTVFENVTPYYFAVSPEIIVEVDVGDVFSPKVYLESLLIDKKPVPKELIKERFVDGLVAANTLPLFVVDCGKLLAKNILSKDDIRDGKLIVDYTVRVETHKYPSLSKDDVGTMDDLKKFSSYAELVNPEKHFTVKMYDGAHPIVKHIAGILKDGKNNPLEIAQACYSFSQCFFE